MNETKKFNLYEDDIWKDSNLSEQTLGNLVSDSIIVYLDSTKPLPELIKPIRDHLEDKPEGYSLGIYLVSGYEINPDISLFVNYIDSIKESFSFTFYLRGILHAEFIHLLFNENIFVENNSKLLYRQETLHLLMKNLMKKPEIFRKFIQRFIDDYNSVHGFSLIDLTELETIGFKFEKF